MKALLTNYRQSPRKVRLVADMIRGKSVPQARALLSFQEQKSSPALLKLLDSAVANARQAGVAPEQLFVKTIAVNKGAVLKRFKPMARGRAAEFRRTMSTVLLELGANTAPKPASTRGSEPTRGGKTVKKAVKSARSRKTAKKTVKAEA